MASKLAKLLTVCKMIEPNWTDGEVACVSQILRRGGYIATATIALLSSGCRCEYWIDHESSSYVSAVPQESPTIMIRGGQCSQVYAWLTRIPDSREVCIISHELLVTPSWTFVAGIILSSWMIVKMVTEYCSARAREVLYKGNKRWRRREDNLWKALGQRFEIS